MGLPPIRRPRSEGAYEFVFSLFFVFSNCCLYLAQFTGNTALCLEWLIVSIQISLLNTSDFEVVPFLFTSASNNHSMLERYFSSAMLYSGPAPNSQSILSQ